MRELLVILAISPLCVLAQPEIPSPPQELDRAVMENRPHVSDRVVVSPATDNRAAEGPSEAATIPVSDRIETDYSDEGRIAGLEGTVHLLAVIDKDGTANVRVLKSLGLGLDENAVEAIKQRQSGVSPSYLHADFILPEKRSRWHLFSVAFSPQKGASRPTFVSTTYPLGAGLIGGDAIDHAQVVAAIGRQVWIAIAFDINEKGIPVNLSSLYATDNMWASQAILFIREWRFEPALIDGKPVTARCVVGLIWGAKILDVYKLSQLRTSIESRTPLLLRSDTQPRK